MRVIVAVEPSIAVVERLVLLQEDVSDALHALGVDAVWNRADELRLVLTAHDMSEGDLGHARMALRETLGALQPVPFETKGTTFEPSEDSPRILAAGTGEGADALARLRASVVDALVRLSLPPDLGEWRPLLRVGRMKTSHASNPVQGVIRAYADTSYGRSTAHEVLVVASEAVGGKVHTRLVDRVPIGA